MRLTVHMLTGKTLIIEADPSTEVKQLKANLYKHTGEQTYQINVLLPPANEVCEGYVFTRVCLSTAGVPEQVPPGTRYTPQDQVHPLDQVRPPGTRYTPLVPGTPCWTRYTPRTRYTIPQTRYTPLAHPAGPGTPPGPGIPPTQTRYTPLVPGMPSWDQVHPPDQVPPTPEQCMLGDTGNKRVVRILLECILVHNKSSLFSFFKKIDTYWVTYMYNEPTHFACFQ